MKRMGRTHRPFYRICATDRRTPRDGRVIEELGTYDPSVSDTNARCTLKSARVDYWLSVGAQPSDKVRVLIKKFGTDGTHLKAMEEARSRLSLPRIVPEAGEPILAPAPEEEPPAAETDATPEASSEGTSPEASAADTDTKDAKSTEPVADEPASAEASPTATAPNAEAKTDESTE
ncbi:MAG TPA: 30S ribosomal protein S16 [Planctomycetaceae bacterium]|nr:30S ribosomal protein S16 [Planctomycetaceae bacterium]